MKEYIPFDKVMGRIENSNNYNRLNITLPNKHAEAVLRYNCGLFVVFKSKSSILKVRYTVYTYPSTFNVSQKIKNEVELMGKGKDGWELLNEVTPLGNPIDIINDGRGKDRNFEITFKMHEEYEEFQLCFPALGRIQKIEIESDDKIEYVVKPLKYIFLGSSVAQDSNDTTHGNLCCYLYRKFGINTATVGISGHNTINFKEMIEKLKSYNSNQLIFMDNIQSNNDEYLYAYNNLHFIPIVINNKSNRLQYNILKKSFPEIVEAYISGDGRFDEVHLNALGTKEYVDILKNNIII